MIRAEAGPARRRPQGVIIVLSILLALAAIAAPGTGCHGIPFPRIPEIVAAPLRPPAPAVTRSEATVVFTVRLPRILLALPSGAELALSEAAPRAASRNPLVGPQVIGVSSRAALGRVLAILLSLPRTGLPGSSFASGTAALVLICALNSIVARRNILALALAGVVVSGFFGAPVSLVQYVADSEDKLPAMVFWLPGSFAIAGREKLALDSPPVSLGDSVRLGLRWRINPLSFGDGDVRALGVPVEPLRWSLLVMAACVVAAQVAVSGIIGWVGLVVPHMARIPVGPDRRVMMQASMVIGTPYLFMIGAVARNATTGEVPPDILIPLIGTPVFAVLLRRTEKAWRDRRCRPAAHDWRQPFL